MFARFLSISSISKASINLKQTMRITPIISSYQPKFFSQSNVQIEDPEIPKEEFQKMQQSLKQFSQCITLGRYKEAQIVLDHHKDMINKYFPQDHPAQYSVINNQGLLHKLNGNYHEAKEMFTIVNQKYTSLYGEIHPSTVNSLINLATVHKDLHEYDLSIPLYEKAIEGRRQLEGENSLNYAMAKAMAAGSYRELGKYDVADQYLKDAYMKIALEFGEDNISAAVILNSMGLLYKKQNKYQRSVEAYERALKIREDNMGEDHPDTIATRHNIAELYICWGNPEKAKEYLQKNIDVMEQKQKDHQNQQSSKEKEESYF